MQSEIYNYLWKWSLKKGIGFWLGSLTILVIQSCEPTLKVSSDFDKTVDFQQYKSFALFGEDSSFKSSVSELNRTRIINSIKNEMVKKGFTENHTNPDVLVNPVAIVTKGVSMTANTDYYGYGGYYRPYYWGGGMGGSSTTSYNVEHYKDGSLIIDIVDASNKKLIWQGIGNSRIDEPLKDPDNQITKAIEKIMNGFPPSKKK